MGCAAAVDARDGAAPSLRALPGVAGLVPGADLQGVAEALGLPLATREPARAQTGSRALLRIQDGCDEHCTFCATTLARGANRSRGPDELIEEALVLAEHHPEIVLTGIHIGSYGADIGCSLGALLDRLVRQVPRVRFRLSSIEATEVDERLRELLTGDAARIAPSLHAPLQSGSDRVLRRMGRHWYTASSYAAAVQSIVGGSTVFGLGADVIAGFPGETDEDHTATVALLESLPLTSLHVFPYSMRPGTAAERLPARIPPDVVARRASELRALGAAKGARYRERRAGGAADVVVVGAGAERRGLTEDFLTVRLVDASVPRGTRLRATLALAGDTLCATAETV